MQFKSPGPSRERAEPVHEESVTGVFERHDADEEQRDSQRGRAHASTDDEEERAAQFDAHHAERADEGHRTRPAMSRLEVGDERWETSAYAPQPAR